MQGERARLGRDPLREVDRVVANDGFIAERVPLPLHENRTERRIDETVLFRLFFNGEVESHERVVRPVEKPRGQAVMLGEGEPFPARFGLIGQMRKREFPEYLERGALARDAVGSTASDLGDELVGRLPHATEDRARGPRRNNLVELDK